MVVVSVGFAFVIGPGEERVRMIAMFLNHLQSFAGLQQACLRFEIPLLCLTRSCTGCVLSSLSQ